MQDRDATSKRMTELLEGLTTKEGTHPSLLEGVNLMRAERYYPPNPVLYEPSIVVIAQGRKKGYLGGRVYTYDANNYLVLAVPLPFECETEATSTHPLLGVSIRADLSVLTELIMNMSDPPPSTGSSEPEGICSTPLNPTLNEAITRLLQQLTHPETARMLGPQTVREIVYHVLCGRQGSALRAALTMNSQFSQMSRILRRIHAEYAQPLDIKTLAEDANMSLSVFHRRFKEITSTPPLQYIKTIRLHQARTLMAREGASAGEAAYQVGYDSPSQFSREFKRLFANTPLQEAARTRRLLMPNNLAVARVE